MTRRSHWALALILALVAALPFGVTAARADAAKPGLFINLSTDDTWAAAKAIYFADQKVLKNGHKPVVIWLNVRAVYLADKKRPSNVPGVMRKDDKSIQDMLTDFIAHGGRVLMCSACSAASGLTKDDYIDGVEMGTWPVVEKLLFDPNIKTLSW